MKIIGESEVSAYQMAQYLLAKNPNAKSFAYSYAQMYLEEGKAEDVRGDGAWIQSCKETGNFTFSGGTAVTFEQNNFCGLGVTKKGIKGAEFDSPRLGIRAQIQHLKAYATTEPLKQECIDPRYKYVSKGCAPEFEDLGGRWAVPGYDTSKATSLADAMNKKIGYGFDIVNGIEDMKLIYEGKTTMTKIAIDAGHGIDTAGKRTVDGYKEHIINVKSASYCEAYLKNYGIDCLKVGWNDSNSLDDIDISLSSRQKKIKNAKCDYSISFHANAHGDGKNWTSASGVETLYSSNILFRKDSKKFAECIQAQLIKGTTQKNRGAKAQSLAMCNCVAMGTKASALVEIGFMTNSEEAELMKQDWFCKEQGEDVARGILNYLGVAFTTETVKPNNTELATFSLVFDYKYYATRYPDLKAVFGFDEAKLFNHFKTYGMKEGRQACASFNPIAYKERYSDLQKAFGSDMPKYYTHYIYCGYREKRIAV